MTSCLDLSSPEMEYVNTDSANQAPIGIHGGKSNSDH